jgi:hypothetical protein
MQATENKLKKEISLKDKKTNKKDAEFIMPTKENYVTVLEKNYTIKQLKDIVAHYKIKLSGASVKADITEKICNYFQLYDKAVIVQKAWRHYLFKHYNRLRGPARFNRTICVNDTDFFTMDNLSDIPYKQFYSFVDEDNMVYGFDIMSIHNLFNKSDKVANPYNRKPFPKQVAKNIMIIIRLSNLYNEPINLDTNEGGEGLEETNNSINFENRIVMLFHDIDHLGNYTNYNWFMNLNEALLMRFIMEMNDIWSYRANLTDIVKREICPEYRNLFQRMFIVDIRFVNIGVLREIAIEIMGRLVRDGINHGSRCLGANFVLCALTLVSPDAADALPWLYQSVI